MNLENSKQNNYIKKNIVNLYRQSSKLEINLILRDNKVYLSLSIYPIKDGVNINNPLIENKHSKNLYDYNNGLRIDLGINEISKLLSFLNNPNTQNLSLIHKTDKLKSVVFNKLQNKQNTSILSIVISEKFNNQGTNKSIDDVFNGNKSEKQLKFILNDDEIILLETFARFTINKYFQVKLSSN